MDTDSSYEGQSRLGTKNLRRILWYNMKPNQQLLDNVSMNIISIMILKHQLSMFEYVELWNGYLLLIQLTGLFPARILQN